MKYLLLAPIAVLLLALLGLPPLFGRLAETAVEARVAAIDPSDPLGIEIESYERGWFSSRARLLVTPRTLTLSTVPAGNVESGARPLGLSSAGRMPVDLRLDHGPVSLHDGFFLGFSRVSARGPAPASAASARDSTASARAESGRDSGAAEAARFVFDARTDLDGDVHFTATVPSLEGADGDGTLSLAGAELSGSLRGDRLTSQGRAARLELAGPRGVLSLEGIALRTDGELLPAIGLPAVIEFGIDRATADAVRAADASAAAAADDGGAGQAGPERVDARRVDAEHVTLRTTLSSDDVSRLLNGVLELETDEISAGTEWTITGLKMKAAADRVDAAAIQAYGAAAAKLDEPSADGAAQSADRAARAALERSVKQLLAAKPTFSIEPLAFDANGQPFEGELDAAARAGASSGAGVDMADSRFWYQVIDGSVKLKAAKSLVESAGAAVIRRRAAEAAESGKRVPFGNADTAGVQASLMLAVLATQGFIEDTGDAYATTLQIENGDVSVNGRRLPFR
jgi:uncharacterized protein YdgA (DUF945 family)